VLNTLDINIPLVLALSSSSLFLNMELDVYRPFFLLAPFSIGLRRLFCMSKLHNSVLLLLLFYFLFRMAEIACDTGLRTR
jgi:hypothetical protein